MTTLIGADLHIHTIYSFDASIHPKLLADQLYAHRFIKTIAVTDHNTVEGYHKVQELTSCYKDILIIPGFEVDTTEGELIILGIEELPPKSLATKNVIDFAKERGAVIIAPHPYRGCGLGDSTKNCRVDAIEVLNGVSSPQANRMAQDLARLMKLPGVAGSDAHKVDELWNVHTEVQSISDVDEILGAIRKGLVRVASTRDSIRF